MDWETIPLEQLDELYDALGAYIDLRRNQEYRRQLAGLEDEQKSLDLELQEIEAQLAAYDEMATRLKQVLKLSSPTTNNNGATEAVSDSQGDESPATTVEPEAVDIAKDEDQLFELFDDIAAL